MTNNGLEFSFINEIVVKFRESITESEKISLMKNFGLEKTTTAKSFEIYEISKERNIIEVANKLYETGLFEFAYPNLICPVELDHYLVPFSYSFFSFFKRKP